MNAFPFAITKQIQDFTNIHGKTLDRVNSGTTDGHDVFVKKLVPAGGAISSDFMPKHWKIVYTLWF